MHTLLNIAFEFSGNSYYSLIRVKEREGSKEYEITVMNGDLERLLYGNHVIKEMNGGLLVDNSDTTNKQSKLKFNIAEALSSYLKVPLLQSHVAGS